MLFKLLVVNWDKFPAHTGLDFSVLSIACNKYLKYTGEFSGLYYISLSLPETLEKLAVKKNPDN